VKKKSFREKLDKNRFTDFLRINQDDDVVVVVVLMVVLLTTNLVAELIEMTQKDIE
jgi:hypothetical protein